MARYELVVFDWDGTLMDSIATIVGCARAALRDLSLDEPPESVLRGNIGLGLDVTVATMMPDATPELRQRWVDRYRHHWRTTFHAHPVLLDGARQVVESLAARDVLLAVATSKSRAGLDRDLATTGLGRLIAATRTVDEAPSKPSPQMLLELLDELGVQAEKALMVGDTRYDIEMARNAAVDAVGVLTGSHDESTLRDAGAVGVLPAASHLVAWLDGDA